MQHSAARCDVMRCQTPSGSFSEWRHQQQYCCYVGIGCFCQVTNFIQENQNPCASILMQYLALVIRETDSTFSPPAKSCGSSCYYSCNFK